MELIGIITWKWTWNIMDGYGANWHYIMDMDMEYYGWNKWHHIMETDMDMDMDTDMDMDI